MAMTRVELNQVFREVTSLEFVGVPYTEETIEFEFSDDFQKKMDKLIARQKKVYWEYVNTAKKRVAIVAIVCLSLFVTACTNPEFREPIIRQMENLEGIMRHYFVEGSMKQKIEGVYRLSKIPDGYQIVFEYGDSRWNMVRYQDDEGHKIELSQYASDQHNYNVNNEVVNEYCVKIRNADVMIFEYSDSMRAIWIEDGYGMGLIYEGCADVEILIEMIKKLSQSDS